MMELTSSWLNAEWENHRTLLSWPRPLRPCSPGATSRPHSSVSSCSRAECRPEPHHQPPVPGYQEFLGTQPPLFHKADEPLETHIMRGTRQDLQLSSSGSRTYVVGQPRGHVSCWHSIHLGGVQRSFQGTSCPRRGDQKETYRVLGSEAGQQ